MMRLATLALLAVSGIATLQTPPGLTVSMGARVRVDSITAVASWQPKCDALGCPDSYRITWLVNGVAQPSRTATATRDSVRVLRAPCPSNTIAQVSIVALRRGLPSSGAMISRTIPCLDAAPPPVDSLKIDTLNVFAINGVLRPGVLAIDSSTAGVWTIDRSDAQMPVMRQHIHAVWQNARTDSARIVAATIMSWAFCPKKSAWDAPMWPLADTVSVRTALARAAQWPADTLRAEATRAFRAYAARSSTPVITQLAQECFA